MGRTRGGSALIGGLAVAVLASCGASVDTESPEYKNGLACRAYARSVGEVGQTIADWSNGLATNGDAASAFETMANTAVVGSTFAVGAVGSALSAASDGWKGARVAILTGGDDLTARLEVAVSGDSGVRSSCAAIGEPIP